jgi:hypothetical protein
MVPDIPMNWLVVEILTLVEKSHILPFQNYQGCHLWWHPNITQQPTKLGKFIATPTILTHVGSFYANGP